MADFSHLSLLPENNIGIGQYAPIRLIKYGLAVFSLNKCSVKIANICNKDKDYKDKVTYTLILPAGISVLGFFLSHRNLSHIPTKIY
jgi:hypothetical protein